MRVAAVAVAVVVNDRPAETPKGDGSRISNLTRTHVRTRRPGAFRLTHRAPYERACVHTNTGMTAEDTERITRVETHPCRVTSQSAAGFVTRAHSDTRLPLVTRGEQRRGEKSR